MTSVEIKMIGTFFQIVSVAVGWVVRKREKVRRKTSPEPPPQRLDRVLVGVQQASAALSALANGVALLGPPS